MIAARWRTPQFAPAGIHPANAIIASDHPITEIVLRGGTARQYVHMLNGNHLAVVVGSNTPGEYTLTATNAAGETITLAGPMNTYDGRRFDGRYSLHIADYLPEPVYVRTDDELTDAVDRGERYVIVADGRESHFPTRPLSHRDRTGWTYIEHESPVPIPLCPTEHSIGNARIYLNYFDINAQIAGSDYWLAANACTFYAGQTYGKPWMHGQRYAALADCFASHCVSGFNLADIANGCTVERCSGDQFSRCGIVYDCLSRDILSANGAHPDWYQCDPLVENVVIARSVWTGRPRGSPAGTTAGQGFFVNGPQITRNVILVGCEIDQDRHGTGDGAKAVQIVRNCDGVAFVDCRVSGGFVVRNDPTIRNVTAVRLTDYAGRPIQSTGVRTIP